MIIMDTPPIPCSINGRKPTDKQKRFAELVASGLAYSAAYREAYDCQNMAAATISRNAWALANRNKIATMIDALRPPPAAVAYTVERHIDELIAVGQRAADAGQHGVSLKAVELVGKVLGLYTQKVEVTGAGGGPVTVAPGLSPAAQELLDRLRAARPQAQLLTHGSGRNDNDDKLLE